MFQKLKSPIFFAVGLLLGWLIFRSSEAGTQQKGGITPLPAKGELPRPVVSQSQRTSDANPVDKGASVFSNKEISSRIRLNLLKEDLSIDAEELSLLGLGNIANSLQEASNGFLEALYEFDRNHLISLSERQDGTLFKLPAWADFDSRLNELKVAFQKISGDEDVGDFLHDKYIKSLLDKTTLLNARNPRLIAYVDKGNGNFHLLGGNPSPHRSDEELKEKFASQENLLRYMNSGKSWSIDSKSIPPFLRYIVEVKR